MISLDFLDTLDQDEQRIQITDNFIFNYCPLKDQQNKSPSDNIKEFIKYRDQGIQLFFCWDNELFKSKEIIRSILSSKINQFKKKVPGRKCRIIEFPLSIAKSFYEQNHLQGASGASQMSTNIGLVFDDEIISMMSFGSHQRQDTPGIVLSRCCFKQNYSIIGGSQKMFKHFCEKHQPEEKIISWSSNRYSLGQLYEYLGFKKDSELKEDYFYFNPKTKQVLAKQAAQKKHLIVKGGIGKTENEMAKSLGYFKIHDCGKIRWSF